MGTNLLLEMARTPSRRFRVGNDSDSEWARQHKLNLKLPLAVNKDINDITVLLVVAALPVPRLSGLTGTGLSLRLLVPLAVPA